MNMRPTTFFGCSLLVVSLISASAWGSDCSLSREFEIRYSQVLPGVLQDPQGMPLSGSGIELLSHKQVVESRRTDNYGVYDFGEIPPGKCRIRVNGNVFCAPKVVCKDGTCRIEPRVKLNSKNLVTVY